MKRRDLMKRLAAIASEQGLELRTAEGGGHTKVWIGERMQPVPRHREIGEITARNIIQKLEGKS